MSEASGRAHVQSAYNMENGLEGGKWEGMWRDHVRGCCGPADEWPWLGLGRGSEDVKNWAEPRAMEATGRRGGRQLLAWPWRLQGEVSEAP